jgi:predicted RNA-binding Zn ribbon-like protein
MPEPRSKSPFQFTAGNLSLDFTNTVDNRRAANEVDLLANYSDFLAWVLEAKVLTPGQTHRLSELAEKNTVQAGAALRRVLQIREAIYAIFSAIAEGRAVPESSLCVLNSAVQQANAHARIVPANRGFIWHRIGPESLASPLWPLVMDAAELLTSGQLGLVRECAAENCGWLFLDTTKNHRRRWCDMKTCGNRNKARRYYQRAQG